MLLPTGGVVELDDAPLVDERLADWRGRIAHAPQFIHLLDDSIVANVTLGSRRPADRRAALTALATAQLARLDDAIGDRLLDTIVGPSGVRLSGGQRQRLGIARALYRDADVLVLDEAIRALDDATERRVIDALRSNHRGKTVIMVAHRLTTLERCDRSSPAVAQRA